MNYDANRKAWMTTAIFSSWLKKVDSQMKKQDRTILLFMDNATCHCVPPKLSNVTIHFLPKNVTSLIQPLDQGIIQNMKHFFRKMLLSHVLSSLDLCGDENLLSVIKSVTVLDAMQMIRCAWDSVSGETIRNCFVKAKFAENIDCDEDDIGELDEDDQEFGDLLSGCGISQADFDDYVFIDNDEDCYGVMTEEDIAEQLKEKHAPETREEDDSDEDDVQDILPTPQDINNAFSTIRRCIHCFLPDTYPTIHNIQTKLMQEMARESNARKKQQKITAYTTSK